MAWSNEQTGLDRLKACSRVKSLVRVARTTKCCPAGTYASSEMASHIIANSVYYSDQTVLQAFYWLMVKISVQFPGYGLKALLPLFGTDCTHRWCQHIFDDQRLEVG